MAIRMLFAVQDKGAECFGTLFTVAADAVAIRDFQAEASNPESVICRHQAHFSLYKFGTWDDATGRFELLREPQFVIAANGLASQQMDMLEDSK